MKNNFIYFIISLIFFSNLYLNYTFNLDMTYKLKTRICNKLEGVNSCNCEDKNHNENFVKTHISNKDEFNDSNTYNCKNL